MQPDLKCGKYHFIEIKQLAKRNFIFEVQIKRNVGIQKEWTKEDVIKLYNKPLLQLVFDVPKFIVNTTTLLKYK